VSEGPWSRYWITVKEQFEEVEKYKMLTAIRDHFKKENVKMNGFVNQHFYKEIKHEYHMEH